MAEQITNGSNPNGSIANISNANGSNANGSNDNGSNDNGSIANGSNNAGSNDAGSNDNVSIANGSNDLQSGPDERSSTPAPHGDAPPSDLVTSRNLILGLGLDPAQDPRSGDAWLEQTLVREQMAELTGRGVLSQYENANEQMRALIGNALRDAHRLGLVHGEALTAAQERGLAGDIVWMVRTDVNGMSMMAPVVYLSAATRARTRGSATIEADMIDLDTDGVHNEHGVISGATSVTLRARGSIVNRSGEIRGGTVDLQSDKDIEVTGGTIASEGDTRLSAAGRLVLDTTSERTTHATTTGTAGTTSTSMRTHSVEETRHTRPSLQVGGNLRADSGRQTTLAGAQVRVRGNADLRSDGDLRIVGRTDKTVERTVSHESGYGINGALFDATDTVGESVSGRHVGSTIDVGGRAGMQAKGRLTLQGADVKAGGDADLRAGSIDVVAAPNTSTSAVTTARRSILRLGGTTHARANAGAGSGAHREGRGVWLGANAAANAGAEGTFELFADSTRSGTSRKVVHRGSAIEAGGALRVKAGHDVSIEGSRLASGGDMRLDARNVSAVAAEDVTANTWSRRDAGIGYYASASAGAQAGIGAAPSGEQPGGLPAAHVNAEAGWQWREARQQGTEGGSTAVTSSIAAGGDLVRHAGDTLRDVGTAVSSGGSLTQSAATIVSEAARDTTYRTTRSGDRSARVGGYASASAGLPAAVEPGQSASTLSSGVGAGAGLKIDYRQSSGQDVAATETAVVSSMRAGGDVSTASSGETRLVGTQVEAKGEIDVRAGSVKHLAAYDTHARSQQSAGTGATVQIDLASPGVGVSGDHATAHAHDNGRGVQVGRMHAGGNVSVRATGDATLEGTTIEGGAVTIAAGGDLAFQSARVTRDTGDASTAANGGVSIGTQSFGVSAGVNVSRASTSDARDVAGGVVARDGAVDIASGGDARFAGTSLSAATDVRVAAGGDVTFDVARERESRDATQFNASLDIGRVKVGAGASTGVGSPGAFVGRSTYAREQETGARIRGSSVHVASGGDTTLIGTTVDADQVDYATGGVRREVAAAPVKITASVVNVGLPPAIRPARAQRRPHQPLAGPTGRTGSNAHAGHAVAARHAGQVEHVEHVARAGHSGDAGKTPYDSRVVFALGDTPTVDRAARHVAQKHPGTRVVRVAASEGDHGAVPDPLPPDGLKGHVKFTMVGHGDATHATLGGLSPERLAGLARNRMRANPDATLGKLNLLGCDSACLTARTTAALAAGQPHTATRVTGETGEVKVLASGKKKTLPMNTADPDALGGAAPTIPVHHHRLYDESDLMSGDKAREDWQTTQQQMIAQPRPLFDMRERRQLERLAAGAPPEGDRPLTHLLETVARLPDHPGTAYGAYRMPRGVFGRMVREGDVVGGPAIHAMASKGYAQEAMLHHGAAPDNRPDRQSVLMVFDGQPAKSLAPFSPYQGPDARTEVYYPPNTRMTVRDILDTAHGTYVWLDKPAAGTSTGVARHLLTGEPMPDYDHRVVMPLDDSGKVLNAAQSLRHKHAATMLVPWSGRGDATGAGGRHKYSLVGEWDPGTQTLSGRPISALADAVAPLAANADTCKVSLVGCHSAALAAPLRDALRERGVDAEVTGRDGRVRVSDRGRKHTVRHDDTEALGGKAVPRRARHEVSYDPAGAARADRAERAERADMPAAVARGAVSRPQRAARHATGPRRMFDEMKQAMTAYAAHNEREVVRHRAIDDAKMRVAPRVFANRDAYDPVAIFAKLPGAYNDSLRGTGAGPVTRDVHALAAALHALPPTPGVSYFATRTPALAYERLVRTGDIVTADIFLSTDMALPDARAALGRGEGAAVGTVDAGIPTLFRIEGRTGRNTTPFHGEANPSLVYAPGTRFEIGAMESDGGVRYVLMHEVPAGAAATARLRPGRPAMERDLLTGHRRTEPGMADAIAAIAPAPHFDPPPPLPDAEAESRAQRFAPLARRFSEAERQYEQAMMLPLLQGAALPLTSGASRGARQPSRADLLALRDFPGASYRGGAGAPGLYGRTIVEGDIVRTAKPLMHSALLADADRASRLAGAAAEAGAGGPRPYLFAVEGPAGRQLEMPRADGGRFGPEVVFPARSEFSIAAIRDTPARTLIWARPYFGASSEPLKDMHTGETLDRR
ncbi:hemagglutinin repeat-containing protein [Cupriavidus sp. OTU4895]|uniref:hemagglutinin repeat-containing protein n=1 Tax=Cupriavidus sp. OTU4895 TaxID=3043852 RepID=UPI00313AB6F5